MNAPLPEVVAELGRRLKMPVELGRSLQSQRLNVSFDGQTLEAAARALAPRVFIDYEIGGNLAQPKAIALHLYG
ncbi:MAG: hypothetical protein ACRD68_16660, partial [Pyrinomonadaceae bacterium]